MMREVFHVTGDVLALGTTLLPAVSFKHWKASLENVGFGAIMQRRGSPAAELEPHRQAPSQCTQLCGP